MRNRAGGLLIEDGKIALMHRIKEIDGKIENSYRTLYTPEIIIEELEKRRLLVNYYKSSIRNSFKS